MILLDTAPSQTPIMDGQDTSPVWTRWFNRLLVAFNNIQATGTTAQRPNPAPFIGFRYFDTTLNRPIWAKTISPTAWVYSDGTAA